MNPFIIGDQPLNLQSLNILFSRQHSIGLSERSKDVIVRCRQYLNNKIKESAAPIYGINTGFGFLQNVTVPDGELAQLQHNLLLSHSCGVGDFVPKEIVKLMLLLKVRSLSAGHSGISLQVVERLVDMYNRDVLPVIYTQGSLGASGDLAPLAHLSLPLIGEGEVWMNNDRISAREWLSRVDLPPLSLQSKEGLALINGTQFMSAYGIFILLKAMRLSKWADVIGALSADAFGCRIEPFKILSHQIRPHKGQLDTAARIFSLLQDSPFMAEEKTQVQDPYSFRCMPQVHGATKDTIDHVSSIFEIEINAVTDNPNVFPDEDEIISAGNFHGQALAMGLDFLSIALAELGNISERRTFQLISGQRKLPNFLVENAGLNSGLMIPQYTAASIVSQNKQLASPASVDSIVSSNGQEDHVSMGANAATKCLQVVDNLEKILAIELMTAVQAFDFRRPSKTSERLEKLHASFRKIVPPHVQDRFLAQDIHASIGFLRTFEI